MFLIIKRSLLKIAEKTSNETEKILEGKEKEITRKASDKLEALIFGVK